MRGNIFRHANRFGILNQTLAGTFAIPPGAPHILMLDTGGVARNVTLPASPRKGDFFYFFNTSAGAFALTLQDSTGAALSPAATVAQNGFMMVVWDGKTPTGAWRHN
jgi:hypothetical protein